MDHRPNYKCQTLKLLDDKMGENLDDPEYGGAFLDTAPKIWSVKETLFKFNFIKMKNFCSAKAYKWMRKQNAD